VICHMLPFVANDAQCLGRLCGRAPTSAAERHGAAAMAEVGILDVWDTGTAAAAGGAFS